MSKWKIFRLHAVMRFAHWLKVPVVPHQRYFCAAGTCKIEGSKENRSLS